MSDGLHVLPLPDVPEVTVGQDLAVLLDAGVRAAGTTPQAGDVVVVSSKVVSKALGLVSDDPDKDRVVAAETLDVVAERSAGGRTTRVVRSVAGPVMAAAGVDGSNTGERGGWLLLPRDPDAAAAMLHAALTELWGVPVGVVLSDTAGRPWRTGQVDFALGAHGLAVLDDHHGREDADGRPLEVTSRAVADEVAAAADLVKGKSSRIPAALVRGLEAFVLTDEDPASGAASLVRTGPGDWFGLGRVEAVRAALGVAPGSASSERVGIPPADPTDRTGALSRAVGLALLGVPGATADVGPDEVVLGAPDLLSLGRLVARFEVAAWSERLVVEADAPTPSNAVAVRVHEAR